MLYSVELRSHIINSMCRFHHLKPSRPAAGMPCLIELSSYFSLTGGKYRTNIKKEKIEGKMTDFKGNITGSEWE
jgi:hypothetical protein